MMGRKLRCTLDLIHLNLKQKVVSKQDNQKLYQERHTKKHTFVIRDSMYTRNYEWGPKWIPGLIQEMTGPVSYTVRLRNGNVVRCHIDQLFARPEPYLPTGWPGVLPEENTKTALLIGAELGDTGEPKMDEPVIPVGKPHAENEVSQESSVTELRQSHRKRRPPERMRDFLQ